MSFRIIAELGSNWWQPDPRDAYQLTVNSIRAAKEAGADAIKLQLFKADRLYARARAPAQWATVQQFEFPLAWLPDLQREAHAIGLELWASCFDPETMCLVAPLLDGLKIASGDLTYEPLLRAAAWLSHLHYITVALSTGASTIAEIKTALEILDTGVHYLILMHCVSAYPVLPAQLRLATLGTLADSCIGLPYNTLGFSDHTDHGELQAQLAYALGARWFEVHFKLPNAHPASPDFAVGREPEALQQYVIALQQADQIIGLPKDDLIDAVEANERIWARRGPDGLRPNL